MATNDITLIQQQTEGSVERTFNPALSGGYIPKFISTGIDSSVIKEDSGNVGIGTASPAAKLDIVGQVKATAANTEAHDLNATSGARLQLFGGSHASLPKQAYLDADNIYFRTSAASTVGQFSSTGLAVTGSIGAKSGGVLQLWDSANADYAYINNTGSSAATQSISYYSAGSGSVAHQFKTYSGGVVNALAITPAGNVGIGTETPVSSLEVKVPSSSSLVWGTTITNPYNDATTTQGIGLKLKMDGSAAWWGDDKWCGIAAKAEANYSDELGLAFYTQGNIGSDPGNSPTEKMRVTGDGDVLIGTTSLFSGGYNAARKYLEIKGSSSTGVLGFATGQADADGNLVGLTEFHDLNSTSGSTRVGYIAARLRGATANNRGSGIAFAVKTDNSATVTEMLHVESTGVGIGTSTPGFKLQVNGDIKIRSATTGAIRWSNDDSSTFALIQYDDSNGALSVGTPSGRNYNVNLTVNGSNIAVVSSTGLAVTGAITATGNITAYYSDDRLKTKLGKIESALDKVSSLEGFYFEANETAQALGYEKKREVGVSAQSVEKVLPEIIAPAPIDPQYKTIDYAKLVPLLIEAIKELKNQVDELNKNK